MSIDSYDVNEEEPAGSLSSRDYYPSSFLSRDSSIGDSSTAISWSTFFLRFFDTGIGQRLHRYESIWPWEPGPILTAMGRNGLWDYQMDNPGEVMKPSPIRSPIRIAVVDNRDSFVYNLIRYLIELGVEVEVFENSVQPEELQPFDGILLSPGPGDPLSAGSCIDIVHFADKYKKPLLGVCLGHQVIAAAFNFPVTGAKELVHGKTSTIKHNGEGVFLNIPDRNKSFCSRCRGKEN